MVLLIAGGSGGHVFPAIAFAERLVESGKTVGLITDERGARFITKDQKLFSHIEVLPNHPKSCNLYLKLWTSSMEFLRWSRKIRKFFAEHNDHIQAVFGFGGRMSILPMVWALTTRRRSPHKNRFCALHQSDCVMGKANRFLSRWIPTVFTGYPKTQGMPLHAHALFVGTPVRKLFFNVCTLPTSCTDLGVLILGGSQGASFWEAIFPKGLGLLCSDRRHKITVYHQCAESQCGVLEARYQKLGVTCTVQPFFHNLPAVLDTVHIVFSRAGASTAAELACAGRSTFFVPYPHATNQHQQHNAAYWVSHQAGWSCPQKDLTEEKIAIFLHECLEDPRRLVYTRDRALTLGRKDAATEMIHYWRTHQQNQAI